MSLGPIRQDRPQDDIQVAPVTNMNVQFDLPEIPEDLSHGKALEGEEKIDFLLKLMNSGVQIEGGKFVDKGTRIEKTFDQMNTKKDRAMVMALIFPNIPPSASERILYAKVLETLYPEALKKEDSLLTQNQKDEVKDRWEALKRLNRSLPLPIEGGGVPETLSPSTESGQSTDGIMPTSQRNDSLKDRIINSAKILKACCLFLAWKLCGRNSI